MTTETIKSTNKKSDPLDLLLKLDKKKLVRPQQEVEIKRLSDILGEPFIVICQALTSDEFEEIQTGISIDPETGKINAEDNSNAMYVAKGIKSPNFGNLKIVEKFGATNAVEAIQNLFLPGEIMGLYNIINKLSGFGNGVIKQIKNESKTVEK